MMQDVELVDLAETFPQLEIDLKYATPDNIAGYIIYQQARCLLHPDAAKALARSVEVARLAGLTLVVYDAWRPQLAQQHLWLACPDPQYVMAVALGSNHSRGTAIDVTLRDEAGALLDMGTDFDEMTTHSHLWSPDISAQAHRNRLLLNAIMQAGGFVGIHSEWWHFELPDSSRYPLLSDRFSCPDLPAVTTARSH